MNKRISLCFVLLLTSIWVMSQAPKLAYSVDGSIKGLASGKIYLSVFGPGQGDSATIKNGKFRFKGTLQEPSVIILSLERNYINKPMFLFFSDGGKVRVKLDKKKLEDGQVKGSQATKDYVLLAKTEDPFNDQFSVLFQSSGADTSAAAKEMREKERARIFRERSVAIESFIRSNASSPVAAYATYRNFLGNEDKLEDLLNLLSPQFHYTSYGQAVKSAVEMNKTLAIGKQALNFTQADTAGRPVSLADFRGKYVLLDFWASWCGPCRKDNPNIVKAFNAFRDKGFTVLGVSLDNPGKKQAWLDAIRKDGLTWTHVSDLKGWDNVVAKQYGITGVPFNLLIDPDGKIVARNLHGDQLANTLEKILR